MMCISVTGLRGVPATWGGVEHQCEQLYSRLAAKGHRITVYARSNYVPSGVRFYKNMRVIRLPAVGGKYGEAFVHTFLAVLHILREKPQIVHFYSQGPALLIPLLRLLRPGTKVFFTCGGLDWRRKKWPPWASKILRLGEICSALFPHCCITVSEELRRYYEETYGVKAHCILNGVERAKRRPPQTIDSFGLKEREYFLSVGRLVPEKRVEDILKAFLGGSLQSKLVIVGDSAGTEGYVQTLRELASGASNILFLGYQYGETLAGLYSNARCFVTASELEGLPLTLLEALSFGRMCLCSDIPPHREIVNKTGGRLFPVGDCSSLQRRMREVEGMTEQEFRHFEARATELVERHFSWHEAASRLEALYLESVRLQES